MPLWELVGLGGDALSTDATLLAYSVSQFVVFAVVAGLVSIRPLRMALAPEPLRRARVNKRATELFLSKGLHLTERRTGVLLFASLADRHATIIADDAVRGQMGSARWAAASDALDDAVRHRRPADGLVEAVQFCGHALAEHHPANPSDVNELPDEVVVI
jgi:putative membrane protein